MMVSSRIATLTRSGTRRVMQLSAQAEASGRKVVHLEVGQPDFPTPTHIQDAANLAVRAGKTGYTVNAGIPELRDAVAQRIRERTGRTISRKHVCVTSGAVNAIFLALSAYLEPGEEVLVPDPGWPNYHSAVAMAGAVSVRYPLSAAMGYEPDFEALERFVSPRTRVLFINTPGNPTGVAWPRSTLAKIAVFAERHDLLILSDEIYEDIVFAGDHVSMLQLTSPERVVVVSGVSKSYSMTGWRIGWLVADAALIEAAAALVEPTTSCASTPSQYAALAAIEGPQNAVWEMRATYHRRMMAVKNVLTSAEILLAEPSGGFFAMVDISRSQMSSDSFVEYLLEQRGVAVAPGSTFGPSAEQSIRISFATDLPSLQYGVAQIIDVLAHLTSR